MRRSAPEDDCRAARRSRAKGPFAWRPAGFLSPDGRNWVEPQGPIDWTTPMTTSSPSRADDALAPFSQATRTWFREAFAEPTRAQELGWRAISAGSHTLIHAPTGSGKTLAAFLWCLDRLMTEAPPARKTVRVLYISPLKALAYDVERNLRAPLAGIRRTADRLGLPVPEISVASRTGDTP